MGNLLKILSNVLEEEKSKEEKDKFKNLTDLYNLCVSKGYIGDMEKFKAEYTKLVEQCSDMLKTSEISDLDLESVAGGVNINVSLKFSLAMIMSAVSLSGATSNIASAANAKLKSKNSSISNKVNAWEHSKSNLTKGQVLSTGLGAAAVGALGTALVAMPVITRMAEYAQESSQEKLYNVFRLVYLLNATDSESVSFKNLDDTERVKLIKAAYDEIGIKFNKKDIDSANAESIRAKLLSELNNKIDQLSKNAKSDEAKSKLSRFSILKKFFRD